MRFERESAPPPLLTFITRGVEKLFRYVGEGIVYKIMAKRDERKRKKNGLSLGRERGRKDRPNK